MNYYLEILRKSGSEEELKVRGDEPKGCEGDEGKAWRSDTSLGVTRGARHWKLGCKVSKLRLACVLESMRWESEHLEGSLFTQTE